MRGKKLGVGYVKRVGMVDVFHDDQSTAHFHCLDRTDRWWYLPRTRVAFRKQQKQNSRPFR